MRIRLSQLRQIIKEELQRKLITEGILDDSLQPKAQTSARDGKWLFDTTEKISKQIKASLAAQNGKEIEYFLKVASPSNPGDESEKRTIDVSFDESGFFDAIIKYMRAGRQPPNEFIDDLVPADQKDPKKSVTKEDLHSGLAEMVKGSFKPAVIEKLQDLGFTQAAGRDFYAQVSFDPKDKEADKRLFVSVRQLNEDSTSLRLQFWIDT